jgi:hypothetical protein
MKILHLTTFAPFTIPILSNKVVSIEFYLYPMLKSLTKLNDPNKCFLKQGYFLSILVYNYGYKLIRRLHFVISFNINSIVVEQCQHYVVSMGYESMPKQC